MDLTEDDWGDGMDWIDLALDRDLWQLCLMMHPRFYLGAWASDFET
jgi:hypothetical protein